MTGFTNPEQEEMEIVRRFDAYVNSVKRITKTLIYSGATMLTLSMFAVGAHGIYTQKIKTPNFTVDVASCDIRNDSWLRNQIASQNQTHPEGDEYDGRRVIDTCEGIDDFLDRKEQIGYFGLFGMMLGSGLGLGGFALLRNERSFENQLASRREKKIEKLYE